MKVLVVEEQIFKSISSMKMDTNLNEFEHEKRNIYTSIQRDETLKHKFKYAQNVYEENY